jgi:hypothetical protein
VNVNQSKSTQASAFVLSRMLSGSGNFRYLDLVSDMVTTRLHRPFNDDDGGLRENVSDARSVTSVDNTILTLTSFVANCDPSPALISGILSPVAPAMYAISRVLHEYGTADPTLRESVYGLLMTWGRIVDAGEGVTIMWKIIQDYDQAWHLDVAGQLSRSPQFVLYFFALLLIAYKNNTGISLRLSYRCLLLKVCSKQMKLEILTSTQT